MFCVSNYVHRLRAPRSFQHQENVAIGLGNASITSESFVAAYGDSQMIHRFLWPLSSSQVVQRILFPDQFRASDKVVVFIAENSSRQSRQIRKLVTDHDTDQKDPTVAPRYISAI